MSRIHALCGVSAVAVGLALVAPVRMAGAQDAVQTLPPVTVEAPAPARAVTKREAATNIARRAQRRSIAAARQPRLQRPTFGSGSVGKDPTTYSVSDNAIGTITDPPNNITPVSAHILP